MPFTDDLLQNYAGFEDDLRPIFVPLSGSTATKSVDVSTTYDPLKSSANQKLYAVPFRGTVNHNVFFRQIAREAEEISLDRAELSFTETFGAWNGEFSSLTYTFDGITVDNNSINDAILGGVELIQSAQTTNPLTSINLTRNGFTNGLPTYTYEEDTIYFGFGTRFYSELGASLDYTNLDPSNEAGEITLSSVVPNTATDGSDFIAFYGGQFSVARYNFPFQIPIKPGESFPVNLGSLQLQFNSNVTSCP